MRPEEVMLALVDAGVHLWVADGRLWYRSPKGALDDRLRGAAAEHRAPLVALVGNGAVLPPRRLDWDEMAQSDYEERAAILTFEGGMEPDNAERLAEHLVRVGVARSGVRWGN